MVEGMEARWLLSGAPTLAGAPKAQPNMDYHVSLSYADSDVPTSVSIDWGDGSGPQAVTSEQDLVHQYSTASGTPHPVVVSATFAGNVQYDSDPLNVTVQAMNFTVTGSADVVAGQTYALIIHLPEGELPDEFGVDWGDGTSFLSESYGPPSHVYEITGHYNISVTAYFSSWDAMAGCGPVDLHVSMDFNLSGTACVNDHWVVGCDDVGNLQIDRNGSTVLTDKVHEIDIIDLHAIAVNGHGSDSGGDQDTLVYNHAHSHGLTVNVPGGITFDRNTALILPQAPTSFSSIATTYGSSAVLEVSNPIGDGQHGLGYAKASDLLGLSGGQTATWRGVTVHATDTLVRYTWLGDTDLDGEVDEDDFARVRQSIAASAALSPGSARDAYATWFHGNFNYDSGQDEDGFEKGISAADVSLMIASFNTTKKITFDNLTGTAAVYATGLNQSADVLTAIDVLAAGGGGTLVVHGMVNLGSSGLILASISNIRVMADPIGGGGFTISSAPGFGAILYLQSCTNILLTGLSFDAAGKAVHAICLNESEQITVDHNTFQGSPGGGDGGYYAVLDRLGTDLHFTGNDVTSFSGCLEGQSGALSTGGVLADNILHQLSGDGINGHAENALISGNSIDDDDGTGGYLGGSGIALSSSDDDHGTTISKNCVIIGNQINHTLWHGIQSDVYQASGVQTRYITVINNKVVSAKLSGIHAFKVVAWNITGNIVQAAGAGPFGNGITVEKGGTDTSISWNSVSDSLRSGIDVIVNTSGVSNLVIHHNKVHGSGQFNLLFRNYDDEHPTVYYGGSNFLIDYNDFDSYSENYSNYKIDNKESKMQFYLTDVHDNQGTSSLEGLL